MSFEPTLNDLGDLSVAKYLLLDALKRFDSLDSRQVMEITFEIAKLGESGLDYASPEKKTTSPPAPEKRSPATS